MLRKMNKQITKLPNGLLFTLAVAFSLLKGTLSAGGNRITSLMLSEGYSSTLAISLMVWWGLTILPETLKKIFARAFYCKKANDVYTSYLEKALKAKMQSINQISSGKIFGLVANKSAYVGQKYAIWIDVTWAIPTFVLLMYKEMMYNPWMFIISCSSILIAVAMYAVTDKIFGWSTEGQKVRGRLASVTADNFNNIRTLKRLKQSKFALGRLKAAQIDGYEYSINISKILYMRIIDILSIAPIVINIMLARENMEMLSLVIIADYSIDKVREAAGVYVDTLVEIKGIEKNLSVLDEEEVQNKPSMPNKVELKDVVFDYGNEDEQFVINRMVFDKNSRTLVYGESGEGKSSLANLISGALKPTVGKVPDVDTYYIWQETEALDDSLWRNIVFENEDNVTEEEVIELFKELNMMGFFNKLKDGFDTVIGEHGCRLSSGQKQRLNIIRLILTLRYHPQYLFIIDEITSNLDSKTRKLAIELINKECKSSLICISHNEGFDDICEYAILVEDHHFKVMK